MPAAEGGGTGAAVRGGGARAAVRGRRYGGGAVRGRRFWVKVPVVRF